MTDLGVLGLDTSHGEAFASVLQDWDSSLGEEPTITAVWDDGTVRDDKYVESFCEEWDATRYHDPAEMVDTVDAAMVLTVDWMRHRTLAQPFLAADIPTLIDKPIAGTLEDVNAIGNVAEGTPVFGGSAVPFHPSFKQLPDTASHRTLHVAGYNDYFYYRVHTVDTARHIVGANWTKIEPLGGTETTTVEVSFDDGTWATLQFDGPTEEPAFAALDVADRARTVEVPATEATLRDMYEQYLDTFLRVVYGSAPDPTPAVLDAARLLLGVETAFAEQRPITPDDSALAATENPSASFIAGYEPYY